MLKKIIERVVLISSSILRKGSFINNLAIFTSGSSLAYVIGFLLTPIIARIYNDEAYGLFAVVNSIVVNITIFSTLNYTEALLIPKTEKKFIVVAQLCIITALIFSGLVFVLIVFFGYYFLPLLTTPQLGWLYYLSPLIVLTNALLIIWEYWNLRMKEFKRGAIAKISNISISKSLTIAIGLISPGNSVGLIVGEYFSKLFTIFILTSNSILSKLKEVFTKFSITEIKKAAIEYKNYPIYYLQSSWITMISNQLPVYLISIYYGISETGQYSIALSLLNAPVVLLGLSIAKVYMQRAVEIHHDQGLEALRIDVFRLYKNIILLSFFPFLILAGFGDLIFKFLLGSGWENAGVIVRYLSLAFLMQFIVLPIKSIFRILKKEKLQFQIDLITSIVTVISLFAVAYSTNSFISVVIVFGVVMALAQLISIYYIFRSIQIKKSFIYTIVPFIVILSCIILMFFLRAI